MSQVYDIVDSTYIYFAKKIKIYGGKRQPKPKQPSAHQQNEKKNNIRETRTSDVFNKTTHSNY